MDRSWMLNAEALRASKECIKIVRAELGIKLTLSHPDFLVLLNEYTELIDSEDLKVAYDRLLALAEGSSAAQVIQLAGQRAAVVALNNSPPPARPVPPYTKAEKAEEAGSEDELIEYRGKTYPKWRDGKRFQGLYRGRPSYK